MGDIVDRKARARMMAGIRSKDTKPELLVRRKLHSKGVRYVLHRKDLPGRPDIVLPKYNALIFINGCFWHCHECNRFRWPSTRPRFWKEKLLGNRERDKRHIERAMSIGWRVAVVWECTVKYATDAEAELVVGAIRAWLSSDQSYMELG